MSDIVDIKHFKTILIGLQQQQRYQEMHDLLEHALKTHSKIISLNYYYGWVLLQLNQLEKALKFFDTCRTLSIEKNIPLHSDIEYAYQTARLKTRGANHDSHIFYDTMMRDPSNPQRMIAYGLSRIRQAEERQGSIEPETLEAIDHVAACINNPVNHTLENETLAGLHNILGMLYREANHYDKAEKCYKKAIIIKPDKHDPHHNYGHLLLLKGQFTEAWQELEYRLHTTQFLSQNIELDKPIWHGENLTNKILHVQAEQGIGDEISFLSLLQYLPLDKLKHITVSCDKRLIQLMERSYPTIEFFNRNDTTYIKNLSCDYYIMLCSLAQRFNIFTNGQPLKPYLKTDQDQRYHFRKIIERMANGRKIIGLAWRTMGHYTKRRNVKLDDIKQCLQYDDYFFVLLQYQQQPEDLAWLDANNIAYYKAPINFEKDFNNIASLMDACDAVLTVDINIVHLAGVMGKVTALLLPEQPNMRWSKPHTQKTLWYPCVHIINKNNDTWHQAGREALAFFKNI